MERNRIRYFLFAVGFFVLGYLSRATSGGLWRELSFVLISAGVFFIFAIILRKSASWVIMLVSLALCTGLQSLRMCHIDFYNQIYDSKIGGFILGAPFDIKMLIYIVLGIFGGAAVELALRQFNKIGMGR
ncbi:MAG: DUF2809 domain-containing protein [Acutalibacteraceae bacterium]